ncbi:MAG TPA: hypothetical protein ENF80_00920 [Thermofilum sp.]|nr:hypothetical protein [Thermofilum sp.]
MYWWPYYPYMYPLDPTYMMTTLMQWIIYPYYYVVTLEMYRAMIDAWRKSLDLLMRSFETRTPGTP